MHRILLAGAFTLATLTPAAAQTLSPVDATIAALDGCYAIRRGGSPASVAAAQGFSPSPKGPDRWVKIVGAVQIQIRMTRSLAGNGQMLHLCTIGVWGQLPGSKTLEVSVIGRAVREGYPISERKPRTDGGTIQVMSRETATTLDGLTLIINEAADPAKAANYSITYGWSP